MRRCRDYHRRIGRGYSPCSQHSLLRLQRGAKLALEAETPLMHVIWTEIRRYVGGIELAWIEDSRRQRGTQGSPNIRAQRYCWQRITGSRFPERLQQDLRTRTRLIQVDVVIGGV